MPGLPQVVGAVVPVAVPGGDDQAGGGRAVAGGVVVGEGAGDLPQVIGGLGLCQAQVVQPVLAQDHGGAHRVAQAEDAIGAAVDARAVGDVRVLGGEVRVLGEDVGEVPVAAGLGGLGELGGLAGVHHDVGDVVAGHGDGDAVGVARVRHPGDLQGHADELLDGRLQLALGVRGGVREQRRHDLQGGDLGVGVGGSAASAAGGESEGGGTGGGTAQEGSAREHPCSFRGRGRTVRSRGGDRAVRGHGHGIGVTRTWAGSGGRRRRRGPLGPGDPPAAPPGGRGGPRCGRGSGRRGGG